MPLIFQYGSNCDERRLNDRLSGAAKDQGRAQTIGTFDITFDVWSQRNACAASDLVRRSGRHAWGVLYDIPKEWALGERKDGRKTLERIEGYHYEPKRVRVRDKDGNIVMEPVTTFLVKRSDRKTGLWTSAKYVEQIVNGLRAHDVPEDYIQHVIDVAIKTNRTAVPPAEEDNRKIESLRSPSWQT